jgi:hypothetical protein
MIKKIYTVTAGNGSTTINRTFGLLLSATDWKRHMERRGFTVEIVKQNQDTKDKA